MTESSGEFGQSNFYTKLEAVSFNRQTATYKGDKREIDKTQKAYEDLMRKANKLGVDQQKLDIAELTGKLSAAYEQENQDDIRIFSELLDTRGMSRG